MSSKAIVDIIRCVMNGLALPDNVTWEGVCDAYGYAKHNLPEEVTAALFELLGQYLRRLPPEKEKIKNLFDYWQGKDPALSRLQEVAIKTATYPFELEYWEGWQDDDLCDLGYERLAAMPVTVKRLQVQYQYCRPGTERRATVVAALLGWSDEVSYHEFSMLVSTYRQQGFPADLAGVLKKWVTTQSTHSADWLEQWERMKAGHDADSAALAEAFFHNAISTAHDFNEQWKVLTELPLSEWQQQAVLAKLAETGTLGDWHWILGRTEPKDRSPEVLRLIEQAYQQTDWRTLLRLAQNSDAEPDGNWDDGYTRMLGDDDLLSTVLFEQIARDPSAELPELLRIWCRTIPESSYEPVIMERIKGAITTARDWLQTYGWWQRSSALIELAQCRLLASVSSLDEWLKLCSGYKLEHYTSWVTPLTRHFISVTDADFEYWQNRIKHPILRDCAGAILQKMHTSADSKQCLEALLELCYDYRDPLGSTVAKALLSVA
ncbi:hypothetical protein HY933_03560 [Candidatus Falkowbacteria bacterium]|nr:hypothetical protein [Candidatus Falkowbacteria bacterium]